MAEFRYTLSDWRGYPDTPQGTLRLSVPGDDHDVGIGKFSGSLEGIVRMMGGNAK